MEPTQEATSQSLVSFEGLTDIQLTILQYLCACVKPPTKKDIAAKLEYSYTTVLSAMNDKKFQVAYSEICTAVSFTRLHEVLETIGDKAVDGSHQHARIFLEFHKKLGKELDRPPPPPNDDKDDLEKKKAEIQAKIDKKIKDAKEADFEEVKDG